MHTHSTTYFWNSNKTNHNTRIVFDELAVSCFDFDIIAAIWNMRSGLRELSPNRNIFNYTHPFWDHHQPGKAICLSSTSTNRTAMRTTTRPRSCALSPPSTCSATQQSCTFWSIPDGRRIFARYNIIFWRPTVLLVLGRFCNLHIAIFHICVLEFMPLQIVEFGCAEMTCIPFVRRFPYAQRIIAVSILYDTFAYINI